MTANSHSRARAQLCALGMALAFLLLAIGVEHVNARVVGQSDDLDLLEGGVLSAKLNVHHTKDRLLCLDKRRVCVYNAFFVAIRNEGDPESFPFTQAF